MLLFTYNDYLDCMQNKKIQKALMLDTKRRKVQEKRKEQREKEPEDIVNQIIEKFIQKEEEIIRIIHDFFKTTPWEMTKDTLKKYEIQNQGKTIFYQYKKGKVYFLIKLQEEPNYHIAYHILTDCTNFIKKWKSNSLHKGQAPIIVPIVIYIGRKTWNSRPNPNMQYTSFRVNGMHLFYNFINLQKYKPIQLMKKQSFISHISVLKMPISDIYKKQILQILKNETQEMDIYLQIKELEQGFMTKEGSI